MARTASTRPSRTLTFVEPFFAAATLARRLGEDLQHIYSSIDARTSTELSVLLGPAGPPGHPDVVADAETEAAVGDLDARWAERSATNRCAEPSCENGPPYECVLPTAPRDRTELAASPGVRLCAVHRIAHWTRVHRPGAP